MPTPVPAAGVLLDRLDALVALAARRRGLVLTPAGALARGEVRSVARCAGLPPSATGEVGLLAALAVAVGLLRVRGSRLEVTRLPALWSALAEQPRAGLVYAAWCQQVTFPVFSTWEQAAVELRLDLDQLVREATRRMLRRRPRDRGRQLPGRIAADSSG